MKIFGIFIFMLFFLNINLAALRAQAEESIYDFTVKDINGKDAPLSDYQGRVTLIVNTASRCGFTGQYNALEKLYNRYKDRGFTVFAFPANNFMNQEPGTDSEIKSFCDTKYNITFPLFSKISVKGEDIHPLYKYLTTESGFSGSITWNFNKFLIGRDGNVIARFSSRTDPLSKEMIDALEKAL